MLLSSLSRKEKLKFLDLAMHIASVDGSLDVSEERLLDIMVAEVGDNIVNEYKFVLSDDLEETIRYFGESKKPTKRIVYMNLFKLMVLSTAYTAEAHFLLEEIRLKLGISEKVKKDLVQIVYGERDLREKALKIVKLR